MLFMSSAPLDRIASLPHPITAVAVEMHLGNPLLDLHFRQLTNNMERKIQFSNQLSHTPIPIISTLPKHNGKRVKNILNQPLQIPRNTPTSKVQHTKRRIPWLSRMANIQYILIDFFKSFTKRVGAGNL